MLVVPLLGFTFIDVASIYALATSTASSLSVLAILFYLAFKLILPRGEKEDELMEVRE